MSRISLKVATISSSLLFGSAFIWYASGGYNRWQNAAQPTVPASADPAAPVFTVATPIGPDRTIAPSSKVDIFVPNPSAGGPAPVVAHAPNAPVSPPIDRAMMPSSKTLIVTPNPSHDARLRQVISEVQAQQATQPASGGVVPSATPPDRVLMSGSKYFGGPSAIDGSTLNVNPATTAPTTGLVNTVTLPPDRTLMFSSKSAGPSPPLPVQPVVPVPPAPTRPTTTTAPAKTSKR